MPWVKLDDLFFDNPKVAAAGLAGRDLYLQALAYSNRLLTDGFIPAAQLRRFDTLRPQQVAARLVAVGLWEQVAGGYAIHDFHEYNTAAATIKAERDSDRQRKAAARSAKLPFRNGSRPADVREMSGDCPGGFREMSGDCPADVRPESARNPSVRRRPDLEYEAADEIATPVGTHVDQLVPSRARQAETSGETVPATVPNPEPPLPVGVPDAADGVEPCPEPPAALTLDQVAALYRDHTATEPGSYERSKFRAMLGLSPPPDEPELCAALRRAYDRATNGRYASYAFGVLKATRLEGTF